MKTNAAVFRTQETLEEGCVEIDRWVGMSPSDLVEACGFHSVENN